MGRCFVFVRKESEGLRSGCVERSGWEDRRHEKGGMAVVERSVLLDV